jgi:hypothetical protein
MAIKIIGSTIIDDSRNIVNAGIATVTSVSIGNTQVVSSARQLQNIASLDATTTATIEAAIQNSPNTFTDLNVTGVSTLGVTSATNLTAQQLNVSGVSTLGTVQISSGIVTANSGIVTYYGDGSKLQGIVSDAGVTIRDEGSVVGTSVTTLNFSGASVSASTAVNGITTITINSQTDNAVYADFAGIATYAGIATNLKGGLAGNIPYQSAPDTTVFLTNGSSGQILQSNGVGNAPTWVDAAPAGAITGITVRDEGAIVGGANSVSQLNFVGNIVSVASTAGIATITFLDYVSNAGIATYASTAGVATALQTPRTFEITGDVVASAVSFDGTGNVSLAATIQPNSVALGSDTTGDYVQSISGTSNQITVTSGTGEGSTPVLSLPNNLVLPQDVTVTRDLQVNRNLNVTGNITIGGTTAFINVQELVVTDPDIILGYRTDAFGNDISNDTTSNHGGVALASTEGNPLVNLFITGIETAPSTYKKIMWFKQGSFAGLNTDAWLINYAVGIGSTQFPTGTRLAAGSVQFTERDLAVVRNINASGILTAGIATLSQLWVSGVSTFNNGPVFIGAATSTGTASQPLQVTGGAYISDNLGVGTTNPQTKLEINGVLGFTGNNNIKIGNVSVGSSLNYGSGENNFFAGLNAGQFTTNGSNNNFLGSGAGSNNTTGFDNNFLGYQAGQFNTEGYYNNFFGSYAGNSNTTGSSNNFFGNAAGSYNTSGISNNFFGSYAGQFNTEGYGNNFIGNNAGQNNIDGGSNNFIGNGAGQYNISGGNNNFFGTAAGLNNTTGSDNNFFGVYAGYGNTTGSYNIFIGDGAGWSNNADYNLGLGAYSAYNNSIGSGNIFIGNHSGISTSASKKVIIGSGDALSNSYFDSPDTTKDIQFAVGVRTDANDPKYWLVGNENFNIGIGTTNPTSKLYVVGNALITGVSTVGNFRMTPVGTGATVGGIGVTYYGDGSQLSNIVTGVSISTNTTNSNQYIPYATSFGSTTGFGVTTLFVFNPSSDNLGIGTTNPLQTLHVQGNLLVAAGSSTGQHITQKAYELNSGTLSWEGSAGQLFSITNNLTSGSIFSVNDVSGIPSIDVNADGTVTLAPYADGNVGIATTLPTSRLHVVGSALITGVSTVGNFRMTPVGTGATVGGIGVTYYGDGSLLTGIAATTDVRTNSLVVTGVSTLGVTTVTNLTAQQLSVSGLSTFAGITTVTGTTLFSRQLNVSGVSTFAGITTVTGTTLFANQLSVSGLSTFAGITTVTGPTLFANQLSVSGVSTHIGISTFQSTLFTNQLSVSGVSTHIGISTFQSTLFTNQLSVSGLSTFAGITTVTGTTLFANQVSASGIITASSYRGDGSQLTGISAGLTITDDTSTNATWYVGILSTTAGIAQTAHVSTTKLTFNPSTGNLVAGGTVTANSDEKLKTDIRTIENALDKVLSLRGVEFTRIDTGDNQIGVIAQEVEEIIPEVVYPKSAPDYETKSVAYANLVGLLIEAVKEQNQRIVELERKLEEK